MTRYLIKHSIEILKSDGILELIREILKFIDLYYTPRQILRWWLVKLSRVEYVVREVQGSLMILNLKDKGIHKDLYLYGLREPQATEYLQYIMEPNWVMLEAGANIGYYALQEARAVKKVIAIEPTPESYRTMLHNIALNGYKNITAYQMAVGDVQGHIDFEISKACNWNRISSNGSGNMVVEIDTIDHFLGFQKIDFLRMDVEGYEMRILQGMKSTLVTCRPRMFIEVHRDMLRDYGSSQLELMQYLAQYGYYIEKSFIMGRESMKGKISELLSIPASTKEITERGIASHIFFAPQEVNN